MFKGLYSDPAGVQAALYNTFPSLQRLALLGSSLGLVGNSALLIGVLLAFLRHPMGAKIVRVNSYCMFAAVFVCLAVSYLEVTDAAAWNTLDATTKGSLIGGLVGAFLGDAFQWGLVFFLFRRSRWG